MKKILFLLLSTCAMYGQIVPTGQEQDFDYGIKNTASQLDDNAVFITVQNSDGVQGKSTSSVWAKKIYVDNADVKKAFLSTGLIKNGLVQANADPTKFNITAGIGVISNFDDPNNPTSTIVSFPAFTGITPTYLTSGNITYIAINSSATIVQQATPFTNVQRRDYIILGAVIHSNLSTINLVNNISAPTNAGTNQLHDLMEAIGALNVDGNKITANGANLSINKTAGDIFKLGVNFANDWKNPHKLNLPLQTLATFRYRTQNGTEGANVTALNPALYDVANVLTAVPSNKFSIQTVTLFQTGAIRVQYGQATYATLSEAESAINTRTYNVEPNIAANGITRAYIILKNTATSLQNASDTKIVEAGKFGNVGGSGGAITLDAIVAALGFTPENVANKQNSLAVDGTGTKYPTVDAINAVIVNETTGLFSNIQTLIDNNPEGSIINLKPNAVYVQDRTLFAKQGITINGNGATLKRNNQISTTLSVSANQTNTTITVANGALFSIGDKIQVYGDDTFLTASRSNKVINIVGNILTLELFLQHSNFPTYTWGVGSGVRKVYDQFSVPFDLSGVAIPKNYIVNNLIFDGNYANNTGNYYWAVNSAIFNNGKSVFNKCKFLNMPNENVVGHGVSLLNCYAENLNGSLIHQSANILAGENILGGEISGCTVVNSNIKNSLTITGHSEGLITFSFTSGRININNNRFLGGGNSVLGTISNSTNSTDGGNKQFIFSNNYCENFPKIVASFDFSLNGFVTNVDNLFITDNVFSNCGVQDWGLQIGNIVSLGAMKFTGNMLTNGTVVSNIPEKMKEGFLLSGGTLNKIPKYNSLGYLVDGSLIDNGSILETTKTIFKTFSTQGTIVSPIYDKILNGGFNVTNESAIYFGNSFGNNNGTYIKLSTNASGSASSPNNAVVINPSGIVNFEQIPTAPTATAGTNTTQIATTAFVQTVARPYKVYTALLSQSGTNAPTATVLENTLGTVVWTRNNTGQYIGTATGAFTDQKTIIFVNRSNPAATAFDTNMAANVININTVGYTTFSNSAYVDGQTNSASIEIRVYN